MHGTTHEVSYADFLDEVLARELRAKQDTHGTMRVTMARFPFQKTLDTFDWKFQPSIDPKLIKELATGRFLADAAKVLLMGPPGVGKTHHENRLEVRLKVLTEPKLLISDEIGYIPIDRQGANLFFQLISRRDERGSILLTSNQSVGAWGEVFGDTVIAGAILDRLLHHASTIQIKGESYRLKEKRRAGLLRPQPTPDTQS